MHNACKCNCVCLPESKSLSGPWLEADSEREFADTETKSFHYVSAEITATSKDNFYFRWDALTYKQTSKPTRYVQAAKWYFKTSSELANRNSKKNNFVFAKRLFDFAKKLATTAKNTVLSLYMQTGDVLQDEICKYLPDSSMPHRLRYQKKKSSRQCLIPKQSVWCGINAENVFLRGAYDWCNRKLHRLDEWRTRKYGYVIGKSSREKTESETSRFLG